MNRDQYFLTLEVITNYIKTAIHETEVYYLTDLANKPTPDMPNASELSWMCANRLKKCGIIQYDEKFLHEMPDDK